MTQTVPGMATNTTRIEGLDANTDYIVQVSATNGAGSNGLSRLSLAAADIGKECQKQQQQIIGILFPYLGLHSTVIGTVVVVVVVVIALLVVTVLGVVIVLLVRKLRRY